MRLQRCAIVVATVLFLPAFALIGPLAAQNQFPANAVIRGENIRVRAEPAEAAADNAILQRGDAVVLTGDLEAHPEGEFYPVQVPASGATGWILALFIDPASIAPGAVTEVIVQPAAPPAVEAAAPPEVEPTAEVVDVPPAAVPATEGTPEARAGRRNRNRANRQQETEPPQEEAQPPQQETQPTQEETEPGAAPERVAVSGEGAMTSDPVTLVAGQYRVAASMTVDAPTAFSASITGPNQFTQTLFNESIDTPQDWSANADLTIPETGDYTVTVSNTDLPWKIRFVPV